MALKAGFIGINKYASNQVSDLSGARKDALALWALFKDTFPSIEAKLLIDEQATSQNVSELLNEFLNNALPEDDIILSFSGHGSQDHRLVLHETSRSNYLDTTISMSTLATLFKESKAKNIILILDCCFSGGAPARVMEDSPISRDPFANYTTIAGKGRVIISASNVDEPAYETNSGHGLLTKAFIDVLQQQTDSISLLTVMGQILEHVRTEASRIGVVQTPVLLGHIEGGVLLPPLLAGSHFYSTFPHLGGVKVGRDFSELSVFRIPETVLVAWNKQFSNGLNDLQLQAINEYDILNGQSCVVIAPTSSGKTFIGELASIRAIGEGRKVVFLLPYRALVNEKYDYFQSLYEEKLDLRIIRCSGDYSDQTTCFVNGKYEIALLTYEMFLHLVVNKPSLLYKVGLIVLDEAQFITDPTRGITVELLLTNLLLARSKGVELQIIALSAVIGNVNDFHTWLSCKALINYERPVPLIEGVLDRSGIYKYQTSDGTIQTDQLISPYSIRVRKKTSSSQDVIVPLVKHLVSSGEKVIVFRNQRGSAQGCAGYLAEELGIQTANDVIEKLPGHDLSSTSNNLRKCLQGGTAFHSTNLTREEKSIVEQAFRDPDGNVKVLSATTTVAAGVNTPASTVIIAEMEFVGDEGRAFTVAEYKNMAGRAGRLGFNETGKAIILADNPYQRDVLFDRYVAGNLESMESSFDIEDINSWIVRLLAQVKMIAKNEIVGLLSNTYGGFLLCRNNPEWQKRMSFILEEAVATLFKWNLLEEEEGKIRLTLLGRVCGTSSLSLKSSLRLVQLLRELNGFTVNAENLIALLQTLPESDGGYTPMARKGTFESSRVVKAKSYYGEAVVRHLQKYATDSIEWWARCKRAAILWEWINGVAVSEIEGCYTSNMWSAIGHGDIRKFADNARYHLRSAHQILTLVCCGVDLDEQAIDELLVRLEYGLPRECLKLLELPISLNRGEYLGILRFGIGSIEELWEKSNEELVTILGELRGASLIEYRP